jgi:NADH:ubiquinone oxidoreductase subunit F (NADH-binding)
VVLPADESEAGTELSQRLRHAQRHGLLDGMFLGVFGETKEVKYQRVLGNLPRQVSTLPGQSSMGVATPDFWRCCNVR